jgi:anti-sigma-K factor RskA
MADETSTGARSSRSEVWDLLPGYALDALDDADRHAVERLLESDADARRSLDEYRDVVAAFAVETEPPAALRANVLELVRNTPQLPAVSAAPDVADEPGAASPGASFSTAAAPEAGDGVVVDLASRRRRRWGAAIAAVAAAAAIAVPTTIAVQATTERDRLREQSQVVAEMLADPDAAILRGAVEGGGQASVLVADDDMFFRAEDLPDLSADQAYQLWVVAEDGSVSSAGVLSVRDGESTSLVQGSEGIGMAVTVEPEAGSEQPTSDPVVVLGA